MPEKAVSFHDDFARDWAVLQETKVVGKEEMRDFRDVTGLLLQGLPLPPEYVDHPLKGDLADFRDFHLRNDLVVIYQSTETEIRFIRIGPHAKLFRAKSR